MIKTRYGSILKRLLALIVDLIAIKVIMLVLRAPFELVMKPVEAVNEMLYRFGMGHPLDWLYYNMPPWRTDIAEDLSFWVGLGVFVLYFAVFEGSWRQATPGKMLMGLFVTDEAGSRLSYRKALVRSLGRVLSMVICFIGFIIALFTPRSQTLHDLIAGSLVLEPDERAAVPGADYPGPGGGGEAPPAG